MIDSRLLTDDRWGSSSVCRRGCCWTCFGHSTIADEHDCPCHPAWLVDAFTTYKAWMAAQWMMPVAPVLLESVGER